MQNRSTEVTQFTCVHNKKYEIKRNSVKMNKYVQYIHKYIQYIHTPATKHII